MGEYPLARSDPAKAVRASADLARAARGSGMAGGQMMDLRPAAGEKTMGPGGAQASAIEEIDLKKTAAPPFPPGAVGGNSRPRPPWGWRRPPRERSPSAGNRFWPSRRSAKRRKPSGISSGWWPRGDREVTMQRLLSTIHSPEDLKNVPKEKLPEVAAEIREMIVRGVARNGGHLASSLGVVELTLALHYVFSSPRDRLVWDVGHQAYAHKILTGRRNVFPTLRTYGGISGFPRIAESPCDAFGTGHSGTSISAALGLAVARDLNR